MTRTAHPPIAPQYFVVMQDFGRRGREATVDPEITRRGVIERIASGEYKDVLFVHSIHDGVCEDITDEALAEALADVSSQSPLPLTGEDRIDWQRDHERDQRKHERV